MKPRRWSSAALIATTIAAAVSGCGGGGNATTGTGTSPIPTVDWPYFGRVPERTHYVPSAPDPPFKFDWVFWAKQLIEFPPAIVGDSMFVVNKAGTTFDVRTSDGKVRWQRNLGNTVTGPAYAHGLVYVAQFDGVFAALDSKTGKVRWTFHTPTHLESSPLAVGGNVYFGSDGGTLFALDASTGKLAWKQDLGAPVKASPTYHDGVVYVGDYAGRIHALSAAGGKPRWSVDTGGGGFYSSPAIDFGKLYEASSNGTLFALTLAGHVAWRFKTSNDIYSSPAVADIPGSGPTVLIGSYNHQLYALNAKTGSKRWQFDVGGQVPGSPTVIGKTVYTSSFQTSKTTGLDARTGKPRWQWGSAGYDPVVSDGRRNFVIGFQTIWAFEDCSPPTAGSQGQTAAGGDGSVPVCQRAADLHLLDVRHAMKRETPKASAARALKRRAAG